MDVGDVIFDSQNGTAFAPLPQRSFDGKLYTKFTVMNDTEAVKALREGFDYKNTIILSETPESSPENIPVNGSAKLVAKPKMDDMTYQVSSDAPAFLLSSGNFHRYWKATVNGKPTKVYKAFGTLRAVAVPAGSSTVRLEYKSDAVRVSLWIGAVSLGIFLLVIGVGAWKKRRRGRR